MKFYILDSFLPSPNAHFLRASHVPGTEINSVFIYLHFAAIQFEQLYKGLLVAITKKEEKKKSPHFNDLTDKSLFLIQVTVKLVLPQVLSLL